MSHGMRPFASALALPLAAALLLGCAQRALPPPPDPDPVQRETYRIGQADVLRITVWKQPELSVPEVPVRPDGKISVPLLDDLQAAGLTPDELKETLTRALSEYVTNPDVTVVVVQVNSKRVQIVGEATRSMALPLTQDMRVLDAIALAGGFTPFADKRNIKILRRTDDGLVEYHFDYEDYIRGKAPQSNLVLAPGDTIVVPD